MRTEIEKQKGVSLIITFFIMVIILAVVLSISVILYSEVKVLKSIANSIVSVYAAESGIEKVLYYDRQVISAEGATRGLCSIGDNCKTSGATDSSVYCNNFTAVAGTENKDGCNADICNDCRLSFDTVFDSRTYNVTASVDSTGSNGSPYYLNVQSGGDFKGTGRKMEITIESLLGN